MPCRFPRRDCVYASPPHTRGSPDEAVEWIFVYVSSLDTHNAKLLLFFSWCQHMTRRFVVRNVDRSAVGIIKRSSCDWAGRMQRRSRGFRPAS
jgi:hypothetical protein